MLEGSYAAALATIATLRAEVQELKGRLAECEPMPPEAANTYDSWTPRGERKRATWQEWYRQANDRQRAAEGTASYLQAGTRRLALMLADRPDAAHFARWLANGMREDEMGDGTTQNIGMMPR